MLRQINNLAHVIGVVRELTIDGLHDRVILAANSDGAHQIVRRQRPNRVERAAPTLFPISEQVVLRGFRQHHEFHVAIALGLLAVSREKICPAREHVAGHVFHVDGDAVRFFIERAKEIFVADLRERALRERLVIAKGVKRVFEIMLAELVVHRFNHRGHRENNDLGIIDRAPDLIDHINSSH